MTNINGFAIATLILFFLSTIFVIRPLSFHIPLPLIGRTRFTIGLTTAPIIAILILWAAQCIGATEIRDGIVGTDGVKPYNILILFISLAYMAITLDITGILQAAAFWDSTDTLAGSAYERKINEQGIKPDTTDRLKDLRRLMAKDKLDYYIVPSEDAHQSEWIAACDKRREFISGFTGTAGQAIVSKHSAFLVTDSRNWLQAQEELDGNWTLVKAGGAGEPKDWIEWIVSQAGSSSRIGIDARMISYEHATLLNSKLGAIQYKLVYPPQNLVDLVWKPTKPAKPDAPIYIQPESNEFADRTTERKLAKLREWIQQQPSSAPSNLKETTPNRQYAQTGTLVSDLTSIAYILNLRGSDIPHNSLFHSYLYVGLESAVLFVEPSKVQGDVAEYLEENNVQLRPYMDVWTFLRRREWGEGKVLITPQTSYAITLMLTHFRYTLAPSYIEHMMSIENGIRIDGKSSAAAAAESTPPPTTPSHTGFFTNGQNIVINGGTFILNVASRPVA